MRFRTVLGDGYAVDEVRAFLARAATRLPTTGATPDGGPDDPAEPGRPRYQRPRFAVVRFREGYDQEEVDQFLDRLFGTLEGRPVGRPVTADEVKAVQFSPVRIRDGYAVEEVDYFLDEAQRWLS